MRSRQEPGRPPPIAVPGPVLEARRPWAALTGVMAKVAAVVAVTFGSLALLSCGGEPSAPSGRSLVLVTLDTTRADRLGAYGYSAGETPNLDRLAGEGALFEHAYAATPVTLPSHASMFTGLDPYRHGVRNNGVHFLPEEATTLAELLRGQGFATAAFVSAAVLERRYGLAQGFETYDDDLSSGKPREPRMVAERSAATTVGAALRWLDALPEGGRFLLWVHLFDPHAVYAPPSPFDRKFVDRPYDGEIAFMDSEVGRLLNHRRAADSSTLVMAIGDHGESLGEHGEASHGMLAYDATLRVPWIARGPGIASGGRFEAAAGQVDLLPTVLELLGEKDLAVALDLSGKSLASILSGRERSGIEDEERFLYAETLVPLHTYGWAGLRSLRAGRWKLIDAPEPELYNLEDDPGEEQNRVESRPADFRRLRAALGERLQTERASSPSLTLDREAADKLRSLGYASRSGSARAGADRPNPRGMITLHAAIERGQQHLYARQLEAAIAVFEKVLGSDPSNLIALADLAKAYAETGRLEEASARIVEALALDPANAGLHLTSASIHRREGDEERALAAVEAALALEPRSLDAGIEKVRVLVDLDREGEARQLVGDLSADAGGSPRVAVLHALLVALPAGRLTEAEAVLRSATKLEPYLAEGWVALGGVLEEAGRASDAGEAYREGLSFQPRDSSLAAALGLLLAREGRDREAETHLERSRALSSRPRAEVEDALATLANRRQDFRSGEGHARSALELDPELASAWNNLAVAREEQGDVDGALEAYGRARRTDESYWQASFNRGLLLRKLGRAPEAVLAFEEVLAEEADHGGAHYELGVLYGGTLGRSDLALKHLEESLAAAPDHPRAKGIREMVRALRQE